MLAGLPVTNDARLLVGSSAFEDAGVFRLSDEVALVQSVDFFTPVVDGAFDFGRIAAANALSDIYAMGAEPLTALAVCAFPRETLPLATLHETLAGGLAVLREEGVVPLGGHTVKGPEFTYGLAVTGVVHPARILTNAGARVGDELVLTKPLGTGVLATALKRGELEPEAERVLVAGMAATNRKAAQACAEVEVHALTDVSGFGLLGHLQEMAEASRVAAEIIAAAVPTLPGALAAAARGVPAGLTANRAWLGERVHFLSVDSNVADVLCDPQTSGGLLAAVAQGSGPALVAACAKRGVAAAVIGCITAAAPAGTITVR